MPDDLWKIYDTILDDLPENITVTRAASGRFWTLAETDRGGLGLAMTTEGDTFPPMYPGGIAGMPLKASGIAVKSWNFIEAGFGMAACNAFYNTPDRLRELQCAEPYENYCTAGLDMSGKTVGIIGHLKMPEDTLRGAKRTFILERHPQAGDYPDSACDFLLPECDVAIITGSSLVNKTLPHLLDLCKNAYVILTGPTVPMCPGLLRCGVDRLAGMVAADPDGVRAHAETGAAGPPFRFGRTFLLKGD